MAKKKDTIKIRSVGNSSNSVTGSCHLVEYNDITIAIEVGGVQEGHTPLENYNYNKELVSRIKPDRLSYIFLNHNHSDHIQNVCSLYATGKCNATIIIPKGSKQILKEMWLDSAKILRRDCDFINDKERKKKEKSLKKCGKKVKDYDFDANVKYIEPLFTEDDVEYTLEFVKEYPTNEIIQLTDELSFRFTSAGHIRFSQQLEMFIKLNNHVKKLLYTSDLGNLITQDEKIFVDKFEPVTKANVVIGESTYSARCREVTKKDLKKDNEKIKSTILDFCVERKSRVFIPSFSLDKTPYIIYKIYTMFKDDKDFKIPIILTSPLSVRLMRIYQESLPKDSYERQEFDAMMNWHNLKLLTETSDIMSCITDKSPKICVSSSGMITNGWSKAWAESILPRENDCILIAGFCSEGTIGRKIRDAHESGCNGQKTITIDGKQVKLKCQVVNIYTLSSHMQRSALINYYKGIQCDKIYLHHGDMASRLELKQDLEEAIANMSKTTKVCIENKSTIITL